jgi:glutamate-1-semialdehyde aminotransferase
MNYNYLNPNNTLKKGVYVYDYVHFRSKPNKDVVTWLNHPNDIADVIHETLNNNQKIVDTASKWYEKINQKPPEKASVRILDQIIEILNKNKD